jgi:hypothetical protein
MSKPSSVHIEASDGVINQREDDVVKEAHWTADIDPAIQKRVIRKIDMLVIPFICITYLVTYIDKAMLGYSAVFGLKESLHLKGTEYSWLGQFGFLLGSIQSIDCVP